MTFESCKFTIADGISSITVECDEGFLWIKKQDEDDDEESMLLHPGQIDSLINLLVIAKRVAERNLEIEDADIEEADECLQHQ